MGFLDSITGNKGNNYQDTLDDKIGKARKAAHDKPGRIGTLAEVQMDMLQKINDIGLLIDDIKEREEWIVKNRNNGNHSNVRSSIEKIVGEIERQDLLKGDEHRIKEDIQESRKVVSGESDNTKAEQTVSYNISIARDFLEDVEEFREHVEKQEPALKNIADNQGKVSNSEMTSFRRIHQEAEALEEELIEFVNDVKAEY